MLHNRFRLNGRDGRASRARTRACTANFGNFGYLEMPLLRAQLGRKGDF
jgi:hypothetical protein